MDKKDTLRQIVKILLTPDKGILAADESNGTADERLMSINVEGGEEMRRKYRDLFLNTPGIEKFVTGVILYDETFWQNAPEGKRFIEKLVNIGVLPGIKADTGMVSMPEFDNQKVTEGLSDLKERLEKYAKAGAKFTKWRILYEINKEKKQPTEEVIRENSKRMAEYAKIVQDFDMVPIVEPEVYLTGPHSTEDSEIITTQVLKILFEELKLGDVFLPGVILKTSMVIAGDKNPDESSPEEVAEFTVRTLKNSVPAETGGIVFLSGGQTAVEASAHLNEIAKSEPLPWEIAFSYGRALQGPALRVWGGKDENVELARKEFLKRLELNQLADGAKYGIGMEFKQ